ncbi:MAG: hypothetical protein ACLSVD_00590 [Eggerthellaceae bacterium]
MTAELPGSERPTTDADGLIEAADLLMGAYRCGVSAPEGYELGTVPVEFTLAEDAWLEVAVTATNVKTPVLARAAHEGGCDDATRCLPERCLG